MTVSISNRSIAPGSIVPFGMYPQTASGIDLSNADNQGYAKWKTDGRYDTVDKIFLLSYKEANEYLGVTLSTGNNQ